MADATNSLAGLITLNDRNAADWEFNQYLKFSPLMQALPWFPATNGTQHKFVRGTSAPGAAFRAVNTGLANAAGQAELVTITLAYLDGSFHRDVAIANAFKDGYEAYMAKESARSLTAAFAKAEAQLVAGTGSDGTGFSGLADYVTQYSDVVVNGGGAGGARVFMMYAGEDGVAGIMGNDGEIMVGEPRLTPIVTDVGTGAAFDAYRVVIGGYMGLQIASVNDYGVIGMGYNFDGTSGHELDDDALGDLYSDFSAQMQPMINLIVTNRAGLKQLQQSRTATNPTGSPAPFPASWNGAGRDIPIVVTDALSDDGSALTTTTAAATTTGA